MDNIVTGVPFTAVEGATKIESVIATLDIGSGGAVSYGSSTASTTHLPARRRQPASPRSTTSPSTRKRDTTSPPMTL